MRNRRVDSKDLARVTFAIDNVAHQGLIAYLVLIDCCPLRSNLDAAFLTEPREIFQFLSAPVSIHKVRNEDVGFQKKGELPGLFGQLNLFSINKVSPREALFFLSFP